MTGIAPTSVTAATTPAASATSTPATTTPATGTTPTPTTAADQAQKPPKTNPYTGNKEPLTLRARDSFDYYAGGNGSGVKYDNTVKIMFLTGPYKGKELYLGGNVWEMENEQKANWEDKAEKGIRAGATFSHISPSTMSFSIDFHTPGQDASQLAENVKHLQEIKVVEDDSTNASSKEESPRTPPLLRISSGKSLWERCVCESIKISRKIPLPNTGGWQFVKVDLSFKIIGGMGSIYQDAPPFAPTELAEYFNSLTDEERKEQGTKALTALQLAPCLGEEESKKVADMIGTGEFNDSGSILGLSDKAFLQVAIAGGFSTAKLEESAILEKLKRALSYELVVNEPGFQNPATASPPAIARAIVDNDPSVIDESGPLTSTIFNSLVADYTKSLDAIKSKQLGEGGSFSGTAEAQSANSTAIRRLAAAGACGFSILNAGGISPEVSAAEDEILQAMNGFFTNDISNADLRRYLAIPNTVNETVLNRIRSGGPYLTKQQFIEAATDASSTATASGQQIWTNYANLNQAVIQELNGLIAADPPDMEKLKERFGTSDEVLINKIINDGRPYSTTSDFYRAVSGDRSRITEGGQLLYKFLQTTPEAPDTDATPP